MWDALEGEAHVWLRSVPAKCSREPLEAAVALLDPGERERLARFRFDRHRELFALAHALVRETLSRYRPVAPADWQFVVGERGRPEIVDGMAPGLRFNLSHTHGLAAVAVTRERDVGVDVEAATRLGRPEEIADRYFSPDEVGDLMAQHGAAARRERFIDFWTLKEAYIKARGLGLAIPLASFSFELGAAVGAPAPGAPRVRFHTVDHGPAEDWQFHRGRGPRGEGLALALRRTGPDLRIRIHQDGEGEKPTDSR